MPGVLLILDGWGLGPPGPGNALDEAHTPTLDRLVGDHQLAALAAAGTAVGLDAGVVGNSETGHITIGAGRYVEYDSRRVTRLSSPAELAANPVFGALCQRLREQDSCLHLVGLCSNGAIHSNLSTVDALLGAARRAEVPKVKVHAITDGRDVSDGTARACLAQLQSYLDRHELGNMATISGRAHAMAKGIPTAALAATCRAIVDADTPCATSLEQAFGDHSDQQIPPRVLHTEQATPLPIAAGDEVLLFNHRSDRTQNLANALVERLGPDRVTTLVRYDTAADLACLVDRADATGGLADQLDARGLRSVRIAEPEKFAHVTYYLNGRSTHHHPQEEHQEIPGGGGEATYRQHPETNLAELTTAISVAVARPDVALVVANLANIDVIGHTGDLTATIRAAEAVDLAVDQILRCAHDEQRWVLLVGDHGNGEDMVRPGPDGQPRPYGGHTTNPVPLVLVPAPAENPTAAARRQASAESLHSLADVAALVLALLEPIAYPSGGAHSASAPLPVAIGCSDRLS